MKLLICLSCILSIAAAVPVRRSASGSASNERLPIMVPQVPPQVPPQLLPQFPPPLPAQPYPPQIPPQPYPPQMIPIYVTYDPAQGLPSILSNLPGVVNPGAGGVGGPFLIPYPAAPGAGFPPIVGK
ncbi:pre-mRNA 3'-end-processing factor FIP1-like [Podarcis raffonei]|uniref:pre-mRNA 3'-end-processing factor FIP1-like n=1 Tax=Podarcis raffonei TaxID=65483 RepID=UPI00232912A4|nr:pre-mRNA 3'-end-processing factor FIP1-like [Podarcis raffonei]